MKVYREQMNENLRDWYRMFFLCISSTEGHKELNINVLLQSMPLLTLLKSSYIYAYKVIASSFTEV